MKVNNNNYQGNVTENRLKEINSRLKRLYQLKEWTSNNPKEITDEFDTLIQEFEKRKRLFRERRNRLWPLNTGNNYENQRSL